VAKPVEMTAVEMTTAEMTTAEMTTAEMTKGRDIPPFFGCQYLLWSIRSGQSALVIFWILERATGFEPATPSLGSSCSTN
jgi:hypothetical protein